MFNTLPESRGTRTRRTGGSIVSVVVHAGVIGAMVVATATAHVRPDEPLPPESLIYTARPPQPQPLPTAPARTGSSSTTAAPRERLLPDLSVVIDIPTGLPPVDLSGSVTNPDDFARPRTGPARGGTDGTAGGSDGPLAGVMTEYTVEKPVLALPGQAPEYPTLLRSAGVDGIVLAQFVVDTTGRVETSTVSMLKSDHALFTAAVRASLSRMRFVPAEAGGRKVRQLVQQPFQFRINP